MYSRIDISDCGVRGVSSAHPAGWALRAVPDLTNIFAIRDFLLLNRYASIRAQDQGRSFAKVSTCPPWPVPFRDLHL